MDNDELVARQARRIAELEDELAERRKAYDDIYMILYCIGGPLNDNINLYTRNQLKPFFEIAKIIN